MIRKKNFVICAVVVYVFLLTLFFTLRDKSNVTNVCHYESPCIRFCCYDRKTCTNDFVKKHFNTSLVPSYGTDDTDIGKRDFKFLFGSPTCRMQPESNWRFEILGDVIDSYDGSDARTVRFHHESSSYCLQDWEEKDSNEVKWSLFVCSTIADFQLTLHYLLIALSVLLICVTLVMYFVFKEMRTVQGKYEMFFLSGVLVMLIALPLFRPYSSSLLNIIPEYLLIIAFIFTFLWLSAMTFDVFWTFRKAQVLSDGSERYRLYCYCTFGFIGALIFLTTAAAIFESDHILFTIYYTFSFLVLMLVLLAFVNVIFVIIAGLKVFQLSRSANFTDHSWFEHEKDRFWVLVQVLSIMYIIWALKLFSTFLPNNYESKIISDLIVLVSTALLFIIFGLKKHVRERLSSRYGILDDD